MAPTDDTRVSAVEKEKEKVYGGVRYENEGWQGDRSRRGGHREGGVEDDDKIRAKGTRHRYREPSWSNPRAQAARHGQNSDLASGSYNKHDDGYMDREPCSSIPLSLVASHGEKSNSKPGCSLESRVMGTAAARVSAVEKMKIGSSEQHQDKKLKRDKCEASREQGDHCKRVKSSKHSDSSTRERSFFPPYDESGDKSLDMGTYTARVSAVEEIVEDSGERKQGKKRNRVEDEHGKGGGGHVKHNSTREKFFSVPSGDLKSLVMGTNIAGVSAMDMEMDCGKCNQDKKRMKDGDEHGRVSAVEEIVEDSGERKQGKKRKRVEDEHGKGGGDHVKHSSTRDKSSQPSGNDSKYVVMGPSDHTRDFDHLQDKERGKKHKRTEHGERGSGDAHRRGSSSRESEERDSNKDWKLTDKGRNTERKLGHNCLQGKHWDARKEWKEERREKRDKEQVKVEAAKMKLNSNDADDEGITISDVECSFEFEGRLTGKKLEVADYSFVEKSTRKKNDHHHRSNNRRQHGDERHRDKDRKHSEDRDRNKDRKPRDKGRNTQDEHRHNFVRGKEWDPGKDWKDEMPETDQRKRQAKSNDADDGWVTISDIEQSFEFEGRLVGKKLKVADYSWHKKSVRKRRHKTRHQRRSSYSSSD